MSLAYIFTGLFGLALYAGCSPLPGGGVHVGGENVAERYTVDPPAMALSKIITAAQRTNVMITASNATAGTAQGTAYRGKVAVFLHVDTKGGQTRLGALARLEPGTFSHGALDLAERILAAYGEGS
jgi:hypothetical protein